jgi:hypothetical protein
LLPKPDPEGDAAFTAEVADRAVSASGNADIVIVAPALIVGMLELVPVPVGASDNSFRGWVDVSANVELGMAAVDGPDEVVVAGGDGTGYNIISRLDNIGSYNTRNLMNDSSIS